MKNFFSLLELLVVILVLFTLLSLLLPNYERLVKNSNSILCQKNLKDIHTLLMSYATDHFGHLPGVYESDSPILKTNYWGENSYLYKYWNGHLIPYIDQDMNLASYERNVKFYKSGQWTPIYFTSSSPKPIDEYPDADIFKNAVKGEGRFNIFLCPETINHVPEAGLLAETGVWIPKMFNLTGPGSFKSGGHTHAFGIPTCYTVNDSYFMSDAKDTYQNDSYKLSEFKHFGSKIIVMEGGNNLGSHNYTPYFNTSGAIGRVNQKMLGYSMDYSDQFSNNNMHFNFPHDHETEYWYSSKAYYYKRADKQTYSQFNDLYLPNVYAAPNYDSWSFGMALITHESPEKSYIVNEGFEKIFGWQWSLPFQYMSEDDARLSAATGIANVMFGDGTVKPKHSAWMFVNRVELFSKY